MEGIHLVRVYVCNEAYVSNTRHTMNQIKLIIHKAQMNNTNTRRF
jgi:hypothetical protein